MQTAGAQKRNFDVACPWHRTLSFEDSPAHQDAYKSGSGSARDDGIVPKGSEHEKKHASLSLRPPSFEAKRNPLQEKKSEVD